MRLPLQLLGFALAIVSPAVKASSSTRNALATISTVQNATIHTRKHRVTALSNFDLTFNLQNELYVKLSLEPNHNALPDDGLRIQYLSPDGSISRIEEVDRLSHKVFKGFAWIQRPMIGQDTWQNVGWARVTVSRDGRDPRFEGAFSVNHDHHHIQNARNFISTRHRLDPEIEEGDFMVVWRDSDILPDAASWQQQKLRRDVSISNGGPTCQADGLRFNVQPDHPVYRAMAKREARSFGKIDFSNLPGLSKRQIDTTTSGNSGGVNLVQSIGNPAGCPTTRKVALVGVATDCTYTNSFNSTEALRENVITQMNTASALWESTFNISLGLQNLTISDASCPATPAKATEWNQACSATVNIQDRLNYFSAWRGTLHDDNSHWTLLSTCNDESVVGLAWLGQACVNTAFTAEAPQTGNGASSGSGNETVSGANVVVRTQAASEWQIIAHETGHTYGAVHDCTSQTCADSNIVNAQQCCPLSSSTCNANAQYIMNPSTGQGITKFSPCTVGNVCGAMGRNSVNSTCLSANKEVTTISGQQCGNGIVEAGEQCDCGGVEGCGDDPCCDPTTCKFKDGAVCDDANEDCCHNCQFAAASTVCRASTGPCDFQEVCTGTSGTCPADQTEKDGTSCGHGLQCASGQCTSRDLQCVNVMGSYTQGNDTSSCDNSGCQISCASPDFGYGVCYGLQQNFLDGTPCGGGGQCQNGQCKGSTVGGEVRSWIDDNKPLVLGIGISIGALLVLSILACIICCCRRKRGPKVRKAASTPPPGGWQGWNSNRVQPQMESNYQPNSQGWYGQGNAGWWQPPVPPPTYGARTGSARYA